MNVGVQFNEVIEVLGTVAFATSGSFAAMQKRLDPFGVLIIAFVTAVGGGTIRDLLLDAPVFWMRDLLICAVVVLTGIMCMVFQSIERNLAMPLFVFDSLGLGLFTIVGVQQGLNAGLHPWVCVALGTITGCFGGIIRDTLLGRIPLIFHQEIYATACIIGGSLFVLLAKYANVSAQGAQVATIALIVLIRSLAVRYHWQIPKFYLGETPRQ